MTSLSLIFLWAPVCTKLNLFSPLNPSYVNLILDQPRNLEEKKGKFSSPAWILSIKLLLKKRRKGEGLRPWVTAIIPSASGAGVFFTWWRSVAVPGHAHSGRASWSAGRWRLGPLSRLVALWPPAAAAQWPEKGRPPTWPGPPLCTGACPCQSLVDGSAISSEESIWPELRWDPPQPPAREPEELGSLDWEALGGQSWVEMSEQTSVDTTGVRIDSNKRRVGERDQTVL